MCGFLWGWRNDKIPELTDEGSPPLHDSMTPPPVFDVTAAGFQSDVLERSATLPVLLDFWAEWCAPCRALLPVLEKVALEYGGTFAVARVDTERDPELAQAFQVQSIPSCVLMVNGRPVDGFTGAIAEPELRSFLSKSGIEPGKAADEPEDETGVRATLARAREAAGAGDAARVRELLDGFPEEDQERDAAKRLLGGIELFEADLGRDSVTPGAELQRSRDAVLAGRIEEAMELALQSIAADKEFRNGLGRRAMLLFFSLLGEENEACDQFRRRLATLLY